MGTTNQKRAKSRRKSTKKTGTAKPKKRVSRAARSQARSGAKRNKKKGATGHRQSKTENFLENIRKNNSMIEYITALRIMNPAARLSADPTLPRREGGFVRLAHAREEFPAPVLNKGKAYEARRREEQSQAEDRKSLDDKTGIDDTRNDE